MPALFVLLGLLVLASLFLPWVLWAQTRRLSAEVRELRAVVQRLADYAPTGPAAKLETPKPVVETPVTRSEPAPEAQRVQAEESKQSESAPVAPVLAQSVPTSTSVPVQHEQSDNFERQVGGRAAVWTGGVALALAGLFLVKYSIDTGLLTESVRVILGCVFGVLLLGAASWVRARQIANGERIGQALSGAGIAVLYVAVFAASSLYGLISPTLGFAGLAGITALAVALSILHGAPIAILGLAGGFLTPALVESDAPSAPVLFIYLSLLVAGLMTVIRAKGWDWLVWPMLVGGLLWVAIWLLDPFVAGDSLWIGLFLAVTSAATALAFSRADDATSPQPKHRMWLRNAGLVTSLAAMAATLGRSEFDLMSWGLLFLLSLGGIALAYFKPRVYLAAPWASAIISATMLTIWQADDVWRLLGILAAFASVHVILGYVLIWRSDRPQVWAALSALSALGFYLVAYSNWLQAPNASERPFVWGALAIALAGAAVAAVQQLMTQLRVEGPPRDYAIAAFAAVATSLVTSGLGIELEREFFTVALAVEVVTLAWIMTRIDVPFLRQIAIAVAAVFALMLVPQLLLLLQLGLYTLTRISLDVQDVPIVAYPLFQLGIPAACFAVASYLFRQKRDDQTVALFEAGATALLGVMIYYLTRHAFHVPADVLFAPASFWERAIATNVLYVFAIGCLWFGERFERIAVSLSALVILGIAIFRTVFLDLLWDNPLFSSQVVGTTIVLNALIAAYLVPVAWLEAAARLVEDAWPRVAAILLRGLALFLLFVTVTLETRHAFHPTDMSEGGVAGEEVYAYSIVWLALAIGVLFWGTLVKNRELRIASLVLMILTVCKVFLYDASELTGLYRVLSFLGLGVSLIGLGYFYNRFVFQQTEPKTTPA